MPPKRTVQVPRPRRRRRPALLPPPLLDPSFPHPLPQVLGTVAASLSALHAVPPAFVSSWPPSPRRRRHGGVDDSDDELPVTRQRRTARRQRLAAIEAATELRNASRRREHIKRQVRARGGRAAAEAEDWEDEGGSDEGGELSGEEEGESEAWLTEVREPAELIDELMQSLVLLFERGAAKGSELARSGPSLQFIDESLSIPQAVIRVLGACAALGGDRDVGDLLSTRAMEQAKELLEASAENEPLVCAELCEAWLPPLLSPQCSPWARIAYLRVLTDLAAWSPLVDLRLEPLLSTFVAWLGYHRDGDGEDEEGLQPAPVTLELMQLLGTLANRPQDFPSRKKRDNLGGQPSWYADGGMANALHRAHVTHAIVVFLEREHRDAGRHSAHYTPQRRYSVWTHGRQLAWPSLERLARHVKGAATLLNTHGVAWVINEEMDANVAKLGHHAHAERTERTSAFIEGLARLGDAMLTFHAHSCAQLLSVEARRAAIIEANIAAADKRNLLGRDGGSDDGLVERQEPLCATACSPTR